MTIRVDANQYRQALGSFFVKDCGIDVTSTCYGLFVPEGLVTTVASGTKTNFSTPQING